MLLLLIQIYWVTVLLGFLDFEFLDFDIDLESAEGIGALNAIALFINYGNVPFGLVLSLLVLNFWILSMLTYYLPIEPGGLMNALLLVPALIGSLVLTKFEVSPLKNKYFEQSEKNDIAHKIMGKVCKLKCDLEYGPLGQAEIDQDGTSFVINVKAEFNDESFKKNELAIVFKKDDEKEVYYIAKARLSEYLSKLD